MAQNQQAKLIMPKVRSLNAGVFFLILLPPTHAAM